MQMPDRVDRHHESPANMMKHQDKGGLVDSPMEKPKTMENHNQAAKLIATSID